MQDISTLITEKKIRQLRVDVDYTKESILSLLANLQNQEVIESAGLLEALTESVIKLSNAKQELDAKIFNS